MHNYVGPQDKCPMRWQSWQRANTWWMSPSPAISSWSPTATIKLERSNLRLSAKLRDWKLRPASLLPPWLWWLQNASRAQLPVMMVTTRLTSSSCWPFSSCLSSPGDRALALVQKIYFVYTVYSLNIRRCWRRSCDQNWSWSPNRVQLVWHEGPAGPIHPSWHLLGSLQAGDRRPSLQWWTTRMKWRREPLRWWIECPSESSSWEDLWKHLSSTPSIAKSITAREIAKNLRREIIHLTACRDCAESSLPSLSSPRREPSGCCDWCRHMAVRVGSDRGANELNRRDAASSLSG